MRPYDVLASAETAIWIVYGIRYLNVYFRSEKTITLKAS